MDDINATMSEVARRVAKLERAMPGPGENKFLRVGAVAGVLGTIISISVGILGVWQAQTEAQEARYAKFSALINDINEYNEKIIINLPNTLLTNVLLSEKYLAIIEANQIYPTIKTNATAPQLAIMASQTALVGDPEQSEQYMISALAIEEKHPNPVAIAELFRVNAITLMQTSLDPAIHDAALKDFSSAFFQVSHGSSVPVLGERAGILHDWTLAMYLLNPVGA
jgi:hypothetical protein